MRDSSTGQGLKAALKADTLSLLVGSWNVWFDGDRDIFLIFGQEGT